jgi:hypothetical protein
MDGCMADITQGDFHGVLDISGRRNMESQSFKRGAYVQLKRSFLREFLLAILLIGFIYLGKRTGINVAPALLPFSIWVWIKKRPLWQARIGTLVFCAGSDVITCIYCFLIVAEAGLDAARAGYIGKVSKFTLPLWIFIALAVVSWIVNQIEEINLLALPLWMLSFLSPLGVFFYFRKHPLTEMAFCRFLIFLVCVAILQCIVAYVDYIGKVGFAAIWSHAVTPDAVIGTFRTTSNFSLYLLEVVAWCYAFIITNKSYSKLAVTTVALGLIMMIFIYTADAKTYLGAFLIGFLTVLFFNYSWQFRDRATKVVVAIIMGMLILGPMVAHYAIERFNLVYVDYFIGSKNNKIQFMERAMDPTNRNIVYWLIGFGPGTCGSRAANMRAYDILYKDSKSEANIYKKFLATYSSQCTKKFLANLYDWHYAETASGRSALLGNPFNSWTAIWFELGVIGILGWGWMFVKLLITSHKIYRSSSGLRKQIAAVTGFNIIAVTIAGLITQTIENPMAMMFLWFFAAHAVVSPMMRQTRRLYR